MTETATAFDDDRVDEEPAPDVGLTEIDPSVLTREEVARRATEILVEEGNPPKLSLLLGDLYATSWELQRMLSEFSVLMESGALSKVVGMMGGRRRRKGKDDDA